MQEDNAPSLKEMKDLQDKGLETLIRVVEIKSDDDSDEATPKKAEWAKAHFEILNKKITQVNPVDIPKEFRGGLKQYYTFDLLKPKDYYHWFKDLKDGYIEQLK
ncbi:hypothetical protein MYX07_03200 [Patescibacteria group bacterium AH-259-L07]|nr:hypothetical protein [Patescibacteria group bacterium AH-259-L07]